MQGIEIPIGAPLGQLDKDLKGAESKLKGFAAEASKSAGVLGGEVVKGSNSAAFALTNLGRVAQDAPFGFIGIQNNLNPLLESFQRLKAETGGTGSALKALGSSLIGPAGLGIALSVVSAGILFYQQYQQRANRETKVATDLNKELADSILTIAGVEQEGRKNAAKDLSNLQTLYNATQNLTIPQKERLKIAQELIKQNPEYLKGFSAEEVLAGKATIAYQQLTTAILAKGLAEAGAANRQKLINQRLEQGVELTKAQQDLTLATSKVKTKGQALPGLAAAFESSQISKNFTQANNAVIKLNNDIKETEKQISLVDSVVTDLINKNGGNILFDPENPKNLNKEVKTTSDILKALSVDYKQIGADFSITFGKGNEERVAALKKAINDLIGIGFTADSSIIKKLQTQLLAIDPDQIKAQGKEVGVNAAVGIGEGLAATSPVIAKDFGNTLKLGLTDFQIYVNEQLLPKLQTNFETFFNDILMNGKLSFDSLGKALINTLLSVIASDAARQVTSLLKTSSATDFTDSKKTGGGGILGAAFGLLKLGKKAAPVVTTAATTTAATTTAALAPAAAASPLLPILAGVAAIAGIASLFKKKQQAPIPQASSTISTSAAGSAQDFGGGRVVFEISGTNLIGVLNRAGAKLQRFGP
jgi:hypothetical protein